MYARLLPLLIVTILAVAACSSQPKVAPENGLAMQPSAQGDAGSSVESYASITRAGAPFYQYGPAQPSGPDLYLNKGDLVRQVRRESGFSQVQLEGGQTGYVSNRYLADAPAPPPPPMPQVEIAEIPRAEQVMDTAEPIQTAPSPSRQPAGPAPAFRIGTSQEAEAPIRFR